MRRIEEIIKKLEQKIINGEWPVGMRLPSEAKLCERFGVSRTVVREALEQLRGRHLISTLKGSGSYVNAFSRKDLTDSLRAYSSLSQDRKAFEELLELRILIECDAARKLAANPNPEALKLMRETLVGMEEESDRLLLARHDHKFHQALVKASGNSLYTALVGALKKSYLNFSQMAYQSGEPFIRRVIDHHCQVVEAIEAGDPDAAEAAMRLHIEESREEFNSQP